MIGYGNTGRFTMDKAPPDVQEIYDSLSLASRHLADAAALLSHCVGGVCGLTPEALLADSGSSVGVSSASTTSSNPSVLSASSVKRARLLAANAVQVAGAAASVATTLKAFSEKFGDK